MKQLIELNIEQAISLAIYFQNQKIDTQHELLFFKIGKSAEFYDLINDKKNLSDKIAKAKYGVRMILSTASGFPISKVTSSKKLKVDLKISDNIFSRLHRPFNRLLKTLGSSKIIKSSEVAKCKTVKDCQDLVIKKL